MHSQFKRSTFLVCLLVAMLLVLSACGSSNEPVASPVATQDAGGSGTDKEQEPDDAVDEEDEEEAHYQTPEMDFDMGGRTIKLVAWWEMKIGDENPDDIQRQKNLDALMKKHNFNVEYVAIDYGEYQEKVTASLLAGEPLGDIVRLGKNYTVPALVKQGLLWPIDEYTKNENAFNQKVTNDLYTYEGRGYGFTENQANFVSGVYYNRTLMNQLGLKPLQEYVDEDNWNWDTFIQVAKEANKDTNNDGKLDTWGLASISLLEPALYSNNTSLTKGDKQNIDNPATIESLNFISKMATEKIGRPTEGGDWREPEQFFRQGNTLMLVGALHQKADISKDMPDYDIGFVPFPKGPSATVYHSGEGLFQALTIPKAASNPEQLMYIWEKINDIDSMYDYPDQQYYETNFDREEDIENIRMIAPNMLVLDHFTYPNLKFWDFQGELLDGISVSTVVEKFKPGFQSAIDEIFGN